jgi:hypothetical protein
MRDSRPRIVWLNADWDTPSWAAALVKLFSRATARKATMSFRFSRAIDVVPLVPRGIDEFTSRVRAGFAILSAAAALGNLAQSSKETE